MAKARASSTEKHRKRSNRQSSEAETQSAQSSLSPRVLEQRFVVAGNGLPDSVPVVIHLMENPSLADFVVAELGRSYQQTRWQARLWTLFSLAAAVTGLTLFAMGGFSPGAISMLISALFLRQLHAANGRADAIQSELLYLLRMREAGEVAGAIKAQTLQNKMLAQMVQKYLSGRT